MFRLLHGPANLLRQVPPDAERESAGIRPGKGKSYETKASPLFPKHRQVADYFLVHCIAAAGQPVHPNVDPLKPSAPASSPVDAFRGHVGK